MRSLLTLLVYISFARYHKKIDVGKFYMDTLLLFQVYSMRVPARMQMK